MQTVWITGARGFIGRHLAKQLGRGGRTVAGLGHGNWPSKAAREWGVQTWLNGDVSGDNLAQLCTYTGAPDQIFHLAGGSSVGASIAAPKEDFRRTVNASAELLDWMRRNAPSASLIAVSSAAVYGQGHPGPIGEDAETRPYSPYGFHKFAMEQLCHSYAQSFGAKVAIVRLFSIYGEGLRKQLLWDLCTKLAASNGAPVRLGGTGEELRDWLHVTDVARLLEAAAPSASDEVPVINGGRGEGVSVARIADLVRGAWEPQACPVIFDGTRRTGDPFALVARPDFLGQRGFRWQTDLADGIHRYVSWFKQCQ